MGTNTEGIKPHRFKKGQSGNPKGRPVMPDLSQLLMETIGPDGVKEILKAMAAKAKKGSEKAGEIVLDRFFGKAKQSIEMKAEHKGEIIIERHVKKPDADNT